MMQFGLAANASDTSTTKLTGPTTNGAVEKAASLDMAKGVPKNTVGKAAAKEEEREAKTPVILSGLPGMRQPQRKM